MAERTAHVNGNTILLSVLAGMTGAAVALLFAPRSGRETRDRIKSTATDLTHQAQDRLSEVRDTGVERARDIKERLTTAINKTGRKAKSELEELKSELPTSSNIQSSVLTNWEEEV